MLFIQKEKRASIIYKMELILYCNLLLYIDRQWPVDFKKSREKLKKEVIAHLHFLFQGEGVSRWFLELCSNFKWNKLVNYPSHKK
jgi:hypothetical protein